MAEIVTIKQNKAFETEFWAQDTETEEPGEMQPVSQIHALTPYGMLLAGLGGCTAIIVNTYANRREMKLDWIEIRLEYNRNFQEDCEHCEDLGKISERIEMDIRFSGSLNDDERKKLFAISKQCPIHQMLHEGIEVYSQLVEGEAAAG